MADHDERPRTQGEPARGERGREAERDGARTAPAEAVRQHRAGRDEAGYPETSDEPAVLGEQERAAERVARRGPPRPGDDEKPP